MTDREASCSCGQLRLACRGEPVRVAICHCLKCQRRTGSVFGVQAFFPSERTGPARGLAKQFVRQADSGKRVTFSFCPECGGNGVLAFGAGAWPGSGRGRRICRPGFCTAGYFGLGEQKASLVRRDRRTGNRAEGVTEASVALTEGWRRSSRCSLPRWPSPWPLPCLGPLELRDQVWQSAREEQSFHVFREARPRQRRSPPHRRRA
jgi:Glutathione-dependent formaldehyde-activating enzyme